MLKFFDKFFSKYSIFKNRPMYLMGESYAGRYVPYITAYIV